MGDELRRRILLREVNAKICEINAELGSDLGHHRLLCECGRESCFQPIEVPASVYDGVREAGHYAVASGHEDVERVISKNPQYDVGASQRSAQGALELGPRALRSEQLQPDAA